MNTSTSSRQQEGALNTNVILTPRKAAIFCLIVWFIYLCTLKKGCESYNIDSFEYLTLAKALISLEGYKILGTSHIQYPFGFPCLLAPVVGIFGYNFFAIQLFLTVVAAIALYVTFIFLKRFSNEKIAEIAFLLTGISYFFWGFNCNWIVSETPYLLFSLLTLIIAQKSIKENNNIIRNSVLLSLLILASYFTRVIGIALLMAVCIPACKSLVKKDKGTLKRLCIILLICGIPILSWYLREKFLTNPESLQSYGQEFTKIKMESSQQLPSFIFIVIKHNLVNNTPHLASLVTSIPKFPHNLRFWGYLIFLLFILGFLHSLIKNNTVVEWYLAFYIGIHLLLPWYSNERYWYPVIPFVFFYLLKALSLIQENILSENKKSSWWSATFFALILCGFFLAYIPLSETQYYESGLLGYYQILVTFVFIMVYFLLLSISFVFAFYSGNPPLFIKNRGIPNLSSLWAIAFAIIVFHNLSMIAYRTYLKHQDYGLKNVGKLYFQEMGQWLRQNSNKNDIVMCDDPVTHSVFSERTCIHFPEALTTQSIIDKIQKENVRYIIIVENDKRSFLNMLNFNEILRVEGNLLFKIEPRNLP